VSKRRNDQSISQSEREREREREGGRERVSGEATEQVPEPENFFVPDFPVSSSSLVLVSYFFFFSLSPFNNH
jgi:hypothetical protein